MGNKNSRTGGTKEPEEPEVIALNPKIGETPSDKLLRLISIGEEDEPCNKVMPTVLECILERWTNGNVGNNIYNVDLVGANLSYDNTTGKILDINDRGAKGLHFSNAPPDHIHIQDAIIDPRWVKNLTEVNMSYANMSYANFNCVNLEKAKLERANLQGAELEDAILKFANLRGADLTGASLRGADLTGADFTYADLTGAKTDNTEFNRLHPETRLLLDTA
jgi:uncharacterized protein YjbI with pentapeptide repeats